MIRVSALRRKYHPVSRKIKTWFDHRKDNGLEAISHKIDKGLYVDERSFFNWLKNKHPDNHKLMEAIKYSRIALKGKGRQNISLKKLINQKEEKLEKVEKIAKVEKIEKIEKDEKEDIKSISKNNSMTYFIYYMHRIDPLRRF